MKTIYKWTQQGTDQQTVEAPTDVEWLSVQIQRGALQIWRLCTPDKAKVKKSIRIFKTGRPVPENPGRHLGTFQLQAGSLVFHAFAEE